MTNRFTLFSLLIFLSYTLIAAPPTIDEHIKIDQFGYLPNAQKIAVISNPINGFNSGDTFAPGTGTNNYQIRRWSDDGVVFTGTLTAWNGGATHSQSGDKVWWFDFSALTTPGDYYVFDVARNVGSYKFTISYTAYQAVLRDAFRVFYYQRCGVAKASPYAETGWTDGVCHLSSLQDTDCRLHNNPVAGTSKDLSGGWHDAGDYNKYVNFAWAPVLDLLLAYEENPGVWGDDFGIPESGNGISDLLDEVKYELDWLLKMQQSNGSVLSVVGVKNYDSASPPSADNSQRFYGPATTSASISAAGMFALGAKVFKTIPSLVTYGNTLQTAAINAWNWATGNPNAQFYNTNTIAAGEQEISNPELVLARKVVAAVFLYAATNDTQYRTFVDNNYQNVHLVQWYFVYPFEHIEQNGLLYYTNLAGATANVRNTIIDRYIHSMTTTGDNLPAFLNKTDAYRAFFTNQNYTWGSNTTKARAGMMFVNMLTYDLDNGNAQNYRNAAWGYIHYLHGVNPLNLVYLSNVNGAGADNSAKEIYHAWFTDGSALWDRVGVSTYGPAPGYVTGGANPQYTLDVCCPSGCANLNYLCNTSQVTPPLGQPIQKAYREWNAGWPQNSWQITEPAIYTQASYLRLLSALQDAVALPVENIDFSAHLQTEQSVLLQWGQAGYENIQWYVVERSTDGKTFTQLGKVAASQDQRHYRFVDEQAVEGQNFYRIKRLGADGTSSYSSVQLVEISSKNWGISPNPVQHELTITFSPKSSSGKILIINNSGQVVLSESVSQKKSSLTLSTAALPAGVYTLVWQTNEVSQQKRFVKL